jgi:hypothetical protein
LGDYPELTCSTAVLSGLNVDTLFVQAVTIPNGTKVTALGVYQNGTQAGLEGILALYADSSGAPGNLVAGTTCSPSCPINNGKNEMPVTFTTPSSGSTTYWVGGDFHDPAGVITTANTCADSTSSNIINYVGVSPFGALPSPFSGGTAQAGPNLNFYVVATE